MKHVPVILTTAKNSSLQPTLRGRIFIGTQLHASVERMLKETVRAKSAKQVNEKVFIL